MDTRARLDFHIIGTREGSVFLFGNARDKSEMEIHVERRLSCYLILEKDRTITVQRGRTREKNESEIERDWNVSSKSKIMIASTTKTRTLYQMLYNSLDKKVSATWKHFDRNRSITNLIDPDLLRRMF